MSFFFLLFVVVMVQVCVAFFSKFFSSTELTEQIQPDSVVLWWQ